MDAAFTLTHRYRGPFVEGKHYGHGGYFCGMVAQLAPGLPALAIKTWVPLERELTVQVSTGRVTVSDGAVKIADSEVWGTPLPVTVPGPVSLDEARAGEDRFEGFMRHPSPECFAWGHERAAGDGLCIFTGAVGTPVNGEKQLAGVCGPDPSCLDADGYVRPEIVWAALDCPGGWAIPKEDVGYRDDCSPGHEHGPNSRGSPRDRSRVDPGTDRSLREEPKGGIRARRSGWSRVCPWLRHLVPG